jgi:hypothetical protein
MNWNDLNDIEIHLRFAIKDRKVFQAAVCWARIEQLTGARFRHPSPNNPLAVVC